MANGYILTYDIITSGLKASLYTVEGVLAAEDTQPLAMKFQGRHAQQSAAAWYDGLIAATCRVLRDVDPGGIACLSFTDQVQVCLMVDETGEPLHDAITWSDTRSLEVADPLEAMGQEAYMALTGQRNTPASPIRKLCWCREMLPESYKKAHKMLGCKDYLALKLTGEFVTDYSDASSTGAFDLHKMEWSREILDRCGIPVDLMPRAVPPTQVVGRVTGKAAEETGLATGTPVVMGSGDFTCSAVGAGCVEPGQTYLNLGSSSWIATAARRPFVHKDMAIVNNVHGPAGLYLPLGQVQEAGTGFKWLKGITGLGDGEKRRSNPYENVYPYHGVGEHLKRSAPGAGGLLYLPFLLGPTAACSHKDLGGGFWGLRAFHTESDITRAVWEGSALYLNHLLGLLTEGSPPDVILATGIASHEEEMLQVLCDVFGIPVENTELRTTVDAIGAAIIGGYGAGLYDDLHQADRFYRRKSRFTPNPAAANKYREAKKRFEAFFQFAKAGNSSA